MRKTCRTATALSLVRNWASAVSGEEHGDLLGGLRVCWHGMTDADYHSWRKPITVVITAPSGPFSVEWNALQDFSVHPPGSALYFLNAEPPGLSVNIAVNGTLPSRLSPLWLGWAPAPQSREVVPLGEADKLHSPLFIISLCSKWSTLFFFFFYQHPWPILFGQKVRLLICDRPEQTAEDQTFCCPSFLNFGFITYLLMDQPEIVFALLSLLLRHQNMAHHLRDGCPGFWFKAWHGERWDTRMLCLCSRQDSSTCTQLFTNAHKGVSIQPIHSRKMLKPEWDLYNIYSNLTLRIRSLDPFSDQQKKYRIMSWWRTVWFPFFTSSFLHIFLNT